MVVLNSLLAFYCYQIVSLNSIRYVHIKFVLDHAPCSLCLRLHRFKVHTHYQLRLAFLTPHKPTLFSSVDTPFIYPLANNPSIPLLLTTNNCSVKEANERGQRQQELMINTAEERTESRFRKYLIFCHHCWFVRCIGIVLCVSKEEEAEEEGSIQGASAFCRCIPLSVVG